MDNKELIIFIQSLKEQSFECWTDEAKHGYLTACQTIQDKILIKYTSQSQCKHNWKYDYRTGGGTCTKCGRFH